MSNNVIYANSRISAREIKLLDNEKLRRLLDCNTLADAIKTLAEFGIGDGAETDVDVILKNDREQLMSFIKELKLDGAFINAVLMKYDFHNVKVLMKAKYMRFEEYTHMLYPEYKYDVKRLAEKIKADDYSDVEPILRDALTAIDEAFASGNRSPKTIDIIIDKAYYAYAIKKVKGDKIAQEYFAFKVFAINAMTFIRAKKMKLDVSEFKTQYIGKQDDTYKLFVENYQQANGMDALISRYEFTDYGKLLKEINGLDVSAAEKIADDTLIKIVNGKKDDVFSDAKCVVYVLAREREQNAVNLILTSIKNKIDKASVTQRLRGING